MLYFVNCFLSDYNGQCDYCLGSHIVMTLPCPWVEFRYSSLNFRIILSFYQRDNSGFSSRRYNRDAGYLV